MIIFSRSSPALSLLVRTLKKWVLLTKSSCINSKKLLYVEYGVLRKTFQKMRAVKAGWSFDSIEVIAS